MFEKLTPWLKNNYGLILALIIYLAVALYGFETQGLINWDEAYFVVVTRTYADIFKTAVTHPADLFSARYYTDLIAAYGNIYTAARPSYIIPAAVLSLIIPAEYSTRILSLLAGFLAIIYFYRLSGLFTVNQKIRFAATFLLAASPLYLSYARLGLSQLFSAAWLIITLYYVVNYYRHGDTKSLKKAGLALSILLMSHYNTLIVVGGLFVVGLFFIFRKRKPYKEYLIFLLFFLIVPVSYEVITRTGVAIAGTAGLLGPQSSFPIFSYTQEIVEQFHRNGPQPPSEPSLMLYYLKLMISPEGLIFFILFLVGIVVSCVKIKKDHYLLILIPVMLHLIFFSITGIKFTRNLITILPALYLFPILSLGVIADFLKLKLPRLFNHIVFVFFFLAVIGANISPYSNLFTIKTNFTEVASFIKKNYAKDRIVIVSSSAPFWRVYLPGYRSEITREVSDWSQRYPDRKIIFIADYFYIIYREDNFLDGFSKHSLREWSTNIFSAKAIVLDFIFQSEKENEAMFAANETSSPVVVYELLPLPR